MPDYMFDGEGMRIDGISKGKTAEKYGIAKGDIVVKIGHINVVDMNSYMKGLGAFNKSDATTVRVKRGNKLIDIDFDGIALGGLSVGESKQEKTEILEFMSDKLPDDKPRYLMGVGTPEDIVEAVRHGIDMFDCVLPTRNARNGQLFTSEGVINIRNAEYKNSDDPIDINCDSKVSQNYSRAYLNHLQRTNEMLGSMLATYHNIYYYQSLMKEIRDSIKDNLFAKFVKDFYNKRNLDMPEGPL